MLSFVFQTKILLWEVILIVHSPRMTKKAAEIYPIKKCNRRDPKFDSSSKFGGRVEIATSKGKRFHLANPRFKNKMQIGALGDNKIIFAKVPCATLRH